MSSQALVFLVAALLLYENTSGIGVPHFLPFNAILAARLAGLELSSPCQKLLNVCNFLACRARKGEGMEFASSGFRGLIFMHM